MSIELNPGRSVVEKIERLVEVLKENNISPDFVAYRLSEEDASVLALELADMVQGLEKTRYEKYAFSGVAHKLLRGGMYYGIRLTD